MTAFLKFCLGIVGLFFLLIFVSAVIGSGSSRPPDPEGAARDAEYQREARNDAIVKLSRFLGSPRDVETGAEYAQKCVNDGKKWSDCGAALDLAIAASPRGRLTTDEIREALRLREDILVSTPRNPKPLVNTNDDPKPTVALCPTPEARAYVEKAHARGWVGVNGCTPDDRADAEYTMGWCGSGGCSARTEAADACARDPSIAGCAEINAASPQWRLRAD
jgi:hypothetical protein